MGYFPDTKEVERDRIARKIGSDKLDELEENGVLIKYVIEDKDPSKTAFSSKTTYRITDEGEMVRDNKVLYEDL